MPPPRSFRRLGWAFLLGACAAEAAPERASARDGVTFVKPEACDGWEGKAHKAGWVVASASGDAQVELTFAPLDGAATERSLAPALAAVRVQIDALPGGRVEHAFERPIGGRVAAGLDWVGDSGARRHWVVPVEGGLVHIDCRGASLGPVCDGIAESVQRSAGSARGGE